MLPGKTSVWHTVIPISFAILACTGAPDSEVALLEPEAWHHSPQPLVTIGEVNGGPEYLFSQIGPAAFLPGGGIAAVDQTEQAVRVYDPEGRFVGRIGRKGEGPGEFSRISSLVVSPPDTLAVYDSSHLRLTKFLLSGELVQTRQFYADDGYPEVYLGEYATGDVGLGWIRQGPRDWTQVTQDEMELGRFGRDGRLSTLMGTVPGIMRTGSSALAFSPHLFAELVGDSLYFTNGLQPKITVWDLNGDSVRTISVSVPELDPDQAWRELEAELRSRDNRHELGWFEGQPRDLPMPAISRMLLDSSNRLWVKEYAPRTDSHLLRTGRGRGGDWVVLNLSGQVIAETRLPGGFLLLDILGNRVLGKTLDDLGIERLEVYRLTPGPSAT